MSSTRHIASALIAAALLAPAPAAAAPPASCARLPIAAPARPTSDPVAFRDAGRVNVSARLAVRDLRVVLRRGRTVYAAGMAAGAGEVDLRFRRVLGAGTYTVVVSGRRRGCRGRGTARARWRFAAASLPVIAGRPSAYAQDYASTMRVVLRSVGGARISDLSVALVTDTGVTLGRAAQPGEFASTVVLDLPYAGTLVPGDYRLVLRGRADGRPLARTEDFTLQGPRGGGSSAGGAAGATGSELAPATAGARIQRVTVAWSDGAWKGSDTAGFEVPGMGTGELVCRPDAGWLRFFSAAPGRETSMMNWVQKSWATFGEQAIREAVITAETGQQFNEGFNKFGPPEKLGTGSFEGIVADRGPFGSPGGAGAPPTTIALSWSWDFRVEGRESCRVEASFVTEAPPEAHPLARSLQIAWRGDENAPGRDGATAIVDGIGRVDATCGAGPDGVRWVTITGPAAATLTQREGSDVTVRELSDGPIAAPIPNNALLSFAFPGGGRLIMSTRHKLNDPNPANNFCFVAGQAFAP